MPGINFKKILIIFLLNIFLIPSFYFGESLLTSTGTFSSGNEGFVVYMVNGNVSWDGVASFSSFSASSDYWSVQLQHSVSLVEGSLYSLCFDGR